MHDKPPTGALHNTSLHCFRHDRVFHRVLFGVQMSRTSTATEIRITSRCSTAFTILVNTFVKSEDSLGFSCKHTQTSSLVLFLMCLSSCVQMLVISHWIQTRQTLDSFCLMRTGRSHVWKIISRIQIIQRDLIRNLRFCVLRV